MFSESCDRYLAGGSGVGHGVPLTIASQNDGHVLVAEGADGEQHGGGLRGDETKGHILPGLCGDG